MKHNVATMERLYLYQASLAVWGLSFLLNAGSSFATGDGGIVPLLFAVSGGALVLGSGYESLRTDPAEFTISAGSLFLVIVTAFLILILTILDVVFPL